MTTDTTENASTKRSESPSTADVKHLMLYAYAVAAQDRDAAAACWASLSAPMRDRFARYQAFAEPALAKV
ncbi:MAG: hypothetical protein AAGF12_18360 [Myxococcota bacterium]